MPLILTFDGLAPGTLTWYLNLDSGGIVLVNPGDTVPVRMVDDYQGYVDRGLGTISGEEDGSDGTVDDITDGLRELLADVSPVNGDDPSTWTLEMMLDHIDDVVGADHDAQEAYIEENRPHLTTTSPIDGATGVSVNVAPTFTFDRALNTDRITVTNLVLIDLTGGGSAVLPVELSWNPAQTVVTLTPGSPLLSGRLYQLSVSGSAEGGDLESQKGVPFQDATATANFATA